MGAWLFRRPATKTIYSLTLASLLFYNYLAQLDLEGKVKTEASAKFGMQENKCK